MRAPLLRAVLPLATAFVFAGLPGRAASRPHPVRVEATFLSTGAHDLAAPGEPDSADRLPRLGVRLANRSERAVWVRVRFTPESPDLGCEVVRRLEPRQSGDFTCGPVLFRRTPAACPVAIVVFADSAASDKIDEFPARLRIDEGTIAQHGESWRPKEPEPNAVRLPKTFKEIQLAEHAVSPGHWAGPSGTLVVSLAGLEFTSEERDFTLAASRLRRAWVLDKAVLVEHDDAGGVRSLRFVPRHSWRSALPGLLLGEALVPPTAGALIAAIDAAITAGRPGDRDQDQRGPPTVTYASVRRTGVVLEGSGGISAFHGSGDSVDAMTVGGLTGGATVGVHLSPAIAVGLRLEAQLGITADLFVLPTFGFVGPDLEVWVNDRVFVAAAVGATYSFASFDPNDGWGMVARTGYVFKRGHHSTGEVMLEVFPSTYSDASTFGVALAVNSRFIGSPFGWLGRH